MIYSWKVCYRKSSEEFDQVTIAAEDVCIYKDLVAVFVIGDDIVAAFHGWASIERC